MKSVNSFKVRVEIKAKNDIAKGYKLLDGLYVFITNQSEKQGRGFKVTQQTIIKAYRDKTKIEMLHVAADM